MSESNYQSQSQCVDPGDQGRPVQFRGRSLTAEKGWFEGTHRSVSPEQTLENLRPLMGEVGITRIADITGLDRVGLPVAQAIRPNAWSLSVSSGKGLDWPSASASAAMEAFEFYHAEQANLSVFRCTYSQLKKHHQAVSAQRLPFRKKSFFHDEMPLAWTFGWDLHRQQEVALPLQLVSLRAEAKGRLFDRAAAFTRDTNGLASGNNFLEALCAGLYEVIERDAWACHLHAMRSGRHIVPKVDPIRIDHPRVCAVLEKLAAAGIRTHLYDCTVDTGVPVYRTVLCDPLELGIPLADGYGAHLDPVIAMLRALTEAAQSRTVAISGSRDDMFDIHHGQMGLDAILRQIEKFETEDETLDPGGLPSGAGQTFQEDVHILASRLLACGLDQLLVVELARCANGMSVVKVVVPGLEPCLSHGNAPGQRAEVFAGSCG